MVLPARDTSETSLSSIADLIDNAFGYDDDKGCIVDFSLVHALLLIISSALSVLERKVIVDLSGVSQSISIAGGLTITAVKVLAKGDKKTKKREDAPSSLDAGKDKSRDERGKEAKGKPKGTTDKSEKMSKQGQKDTEKDKRKIKIAQKSSSSSESEYSEEIAQISGEISPGEKVEKGKGFTEKGSDKASSKDETPLDKTAKTKEGKEETSSQKASKSKGGNNEASSDKTSKIKKGKSAKSSIKSDGVNEDISDTEKSSKSFGDEDSIEIKQAGDDSKTSKIGSKGEKISKSSSDTADFDKESIIIVEKLSQPELSATKTRSREQVVPQSLVTREQFTEMMHDVMQLQKRFGVTDDKSLALMSALGRSASLSEPIAILQLSARLEAVEKALDQMMTVVKDLVKRTPGLGATSRAGVRDQAISKDGADSDDNKSTIKFSKQTEAKTKTPTKTDTILKEYTDRSLPSPSVSRGGDTVSMSASMIGVSLITDVKSKNLITYSELRNRMKELEDLVNRAIAGPAARAQLTSDNAGKLAHRLFTSLEKSLNVTERMTSLEDSVAQYSEKINYVDMQFSLKMTSYQEELSQMQHNLDLSLDNMAEALANRATDVEAVSELNNRFTALQIDIDRTMDLQSELKKTQLNLENDLKTLCAQIEALRIKKSDREEVAEALSTKAGLSFLNGKISYPQYEAVRGDIEKRIAAAYDKFNSHENSWQKHIDELMRNLNDKADTYKVELLKSSINENIDMLRQRLEFMINVCGDKRKTDIKRQVLRHLPCICCSTPADLDKDEPEEGKKCHKRLKRPISEGIDLDEKDEGDGDGHLPCIPNTPINHALDKRARICPKYCGYASPSSDSETSPGILSSVCVQPLTKEPKLKPEMTSVKLPCMPCNFPEKKGQEKGSRRDTEKKTIDTPATDTPRLSFE